MSSNENIKEPAFTNIFRQTVQTKSTPIPSKATTVTNNFSTLAPTAKLITTSNTTNISNNYNTNTTTTTTNTNNNNNNNNYFNANYTPSLIQARTPGVNNINNNSKHYNRHTIAISQQESFENFYLNPKVDDDFYNENYEPLSTPKKQTKSTTTPSTRQHLYYQLNEQYETNNAITNNRALNNSSPLSKTPDSNTDIDNWIDVPDSGKLFKKIFYYI
jgi:hypothetical protein